jgi:hypothetical protein
MLDTDDTARGADDMPTFTAAPTMRPGGKPVTITICKGNHVRISNVMRIMVNRR